MGTYIVEGNLKHDGMKYTTGETVELGEKDTKALLEIGRVRPALGGEAEQTEPEQQNPEGKLEGVTDNQPEPLQPVEQPQGDNQQGDDAGQQPQGDGDGGQDGGEPQPQTPVV